MSPLWNLKYQEQKKKSADDTDYNLEEKERLLYDQVCLCYLFTFFKYHEDQVL